MSINNPIPKPPVPTWAYSRDTAILSVILMNVYHLDIAVIEHVISVERSLSYAYWFPLRSIPQ